VGGKSYLKTNDNTRQRAGKSKHVQGGNSTIDLGVLPRRRHTVKTTNEGSSKKREKFPEGKKKGMRGARPTPTGITGKLAAGSTHQARSKPRAPAQ